MLTNIMGQSRFKSNLSSPRSLAAHLPLISSAVISYTPLEACHCLADWAVDGLGGVAELIATSLFSAQFNAHFVICLPLAIPVQLLASAMMLRSISR